MLSAQSELLLRNTDLFEQGRWLLINAADTQIFAELKDYDISGFHQYFDVFQAANAAHAKQTYSAAIQLDKPKEAYAGVIIYLPKSKAHLDMLLANARSVVDKEGTIAVVGTNDGGIKSIGKRLKQQFSQAQKRDSARHCALWCSPNKACHTPFKIDDYIEVNTYSLNGINWKIASLPGVFSHGDLDPGTQLLLESLPDKLPKKILDFACGAGVIGCYLAQRQSDLSLSFSDINALALHACRQSCELNGLTADIRASNGLSEWSSQRFKLIVTNPPFHSGIATNYEVTETFIHQAGEHLTRGGDLYLVANRFLPYPELLDKHLIRKADLSRSSKYTVYHAVKR